MDLVYLILGLALLVGAGDTLVRGAVALSLRFGIPAIIVSATIVAFGTSAPELLISIQAVLDDAPGIALGNVIGSNIFNVLGILGLTAVVYPLVIPAEMLGLSLWVFALAALAPAALMLAFGRLGRAAGFAFVGAYAAYTGILVIGAL